MTWPAHLREMWDADRASQALGMEIEELAPGRAVVSMTVRDDMVNGHGIGHGGLTFSLADSAFAFACNSHGPVTVAHSATIRFRAPVRQGETLVAEAVERTVEGRFGVYDVTVTAHDGDQARVVAEFTGHSTRLRVAT